MVESEHTHHTAGFTMILKVVQLCIFFMGVRSAVLRSNYWTLGKYNPT